MPVVYSKEENDSLIRGCWQVCFILLACIMVNSYSTSLASTYGTQRAFTISQSLSLGGGIISLATAATMVSRFEKDGEFPTALRFQLAFMLSLLLTIGAFGCAAVGQLQVLPGLDAMIGGIISISSVGISLLIGILEACAVSKGL